MKVLVTGAGGQLGQDLLRAFGDHEVVAATHDLLDVGDRDQVLGTITGIGPDLVVHAAAWTAVDACEGDPDLAYRVNALGARHVADACARSGAHLCAVSTDYVFDGTSARPYREWDETKPLGVYGRSKLAGEREILGLLPGASVVRTSWLCGAGGPNFVKTMLGLASNGDAEIRVVDDQHGCPTFTADLAPLIRVVAVSRRPGLFHATNQGPTTWWAFARSIFEACGADPSRVVAITTAELEPPRAAPRPAYSVLDNAALRLSGLALLPDHHEALERLVKELS
ncbi:MAG: dTDP-4-dehydrorhamnose reductase [Actinobacteria bacterium]|nr:dTDP-4-dehydrorhamnose reductase [Actinomycetota bacterium]